jgi:hypothetical protein
MSKFDILSSASWLDAGNFYVYGDIQIGKTSEIMRIINHLTRNGYCVVYLTQPLKMLRTQTANDFQDQRNKLLTALDHGICRKIEDRISLEMLNRIEANDPGLLLCDLMHTTRLRNFIQSLKGDQGYKKTIRQKLVVVYDEADLYLSELKEIVENEDTELAEKLTSMNKIAEIEKDMSEINDLVHSTIRISGTICGPLLSAIKADNRPDHKKIVLIPRNNPHYQNIKNFVTTPAHNIDRTNYTASDDRNIPEFVRSVLSRDDEPVAMLQIHRYKDQHTSINAEVQKIVEMEGKEKETAILIINQDTGNDSVADRIRDAHKDGKKYIFLVGGVKLERGIRCASSECLADHRHLTDLYILPPKNPVMATLLQQMRLSGSYATNKPRCLLIPEDAFSQVMSYYNLQMEFFAELQKPVHKQRTLLEIDRNMKQTHILSQRHSQAIGLKINNRKGFRTLADAIAYAAKQTTLPVPVISEVMTVPHNWTATDRANLTEEHSIIRRTNGPHNELRRWVYSSGESVDAGDHFILSSQPRREVLGKYFIEVNIKKGMVCKTNPYIVRFPYSLDIGDK